MVATGSTLWRFLRHFAAPPVVFTLASFALFVGLVHEVAGVAARARRLDLEADVVRAEIAAWTVARTIDPEGASAALAADVAGLRIDIRPGDDRWCLDATAADGSRQCFEAEVVAGAGPSVLGRHRVAYGDEAAMALGVPCEPAVVPFPTIDAPQLAAAVRPDRFPGFRRDPGIALRHFATGTDGDDYVWAPVGPVRLPGDGALVVVPGHLWFEAGPLAARIELRHDLVVVVQGNLYVGRSLQVTGGGRLLFVVVPGPRAVLFADRDGSGGWSVGDVLRAGAAFAGPVEGGGAVYLGLAGGERAIDCAAGLVVAGELHVAAESCVDGPVVVRHGVTRLHPAAALAPSRTPWAFRPARERIPGLVTTGPPRLGWLRRRVGDSPHAERQPLFLATPTR